VIQSAEAESERASAATSLRLAGSCPAGIFWTSGPLPDKPRNNSPLIPFAGLLTKRSAVTSRAEQNRQLARNCRSLARSLPPGESRVAMQEMAQQWDRWQTSRSTPLICGRRALVSDDFRTHHFDSPILERFFWTSDPLPDTPRNDSPLIGFAGLLTKRAVYDEWSGK
jgi:hypothetical protein